MKYVLLFFKWLYYCKITQKHQYRRMARVPKGLSKETITYRCDICGKWKSETGLFPPEHEYCKCMRSDNID